VRVVPKRRGGGLGAWAARFRVDVVERPYFSVRARFPLRDEGGLCEDGGNAHYAFGIERE
jgi:hypothetical protein